MDVGYMLLRAMSDSLIKRRLRGDMIAVDKYFQGQQMFNSGLLSVAEKDIIQPNVWKLKLDWK